jgi:hypothetical protein
VKLLNSFSTGDAIILINPPTKGTAKIKANGTKRKLATTVSIGDNNTDVKEK